MTTVDTAIIGGGISGLTTAYRLARMGRSVIVLERQARTGGNAQSDRVGGFLMEHGPSTVNGMAAEVTALGRELGIDGLRRDLGEGVRRRYLVKDGGLSGIPVGPLGFLTSDYLSLKGRLRVFAEPFVGRSSHSGDESVAAYCARRFGREFADRVMDPLVGGLYAGLADQLSVSAVFPRLVELERRFGSVTMGAVRGRMRGGRMPGSRLYSWRDGIGTLPKALTAALGARIRTGTTVHAIRRLSDGFAVDTGPDGTVRARSVVIATQPHVAARMLEPLDGDAAAAVGSIAAPPIAVVFLAYDRDQIDHPLDGLGFLSPSGEDRALTGSLFCSTMFANRAPGGKVALSVYFGGARAPELGRQSGDALIALAREELRQLIGARGMPLQTRVRHWPVGLPQATVGHPDRTACLESVCERVPGLYLTGNYFGGPSVGNCVARAYAQAVEVGAFLDRSGPSESQDFSAAAIR